ncbi:MAG: iron-containing alcohol dehydrogenase [Desulfovibrionales bacterium]|nr:iron-containing alcohol dehydrogenase [Desulfovibrionales bacterium]
MSYLPLRKFAAPEIIFGLGALDLVGQYTAKFGMSKPLVVSDPGVINSGWADKTIHDLDHLGITSALFSNITPNPRAQEVMAGVQVYHEEQCDGLIAVGGGSPMDCAKAIGIVVSNAGHILEYEGVDKIVIPMPPLICLPTTAGTSADISQFSIINDTERRTKIAIISKAIIPDLALIDPQTLMTMPPYEAACTGMDALTHAIEAFVSNAQSAMTDVHALEAIRLIYGSLVKSLANPEDMELRAQIMLGSMQAGLAFSNASLGAVHALAHSLGGYKDLPHGECNAILLPHVIDFNFSAVPQRFTLIAQTMGLDTQKMTTSMIQKWLLKTIYALRAAVGIKDTLKDKGVSSQDIPILAAKAVLDPCLVTNPKSINQHDIEKIYEKAM